MTDHEAENQDIEKLYEEKMRETMADIARCLDEYLCSPGPWWAQQPVPVNPCPPTRPERLLAWLHNVRVQFYWWRCRHFWQPIHDWTRKHGADCEEQDD